MARLTPNFSHRFVPSSDESCGSALLLLHSAGGNEHEMLPIAARLSTGAALLSPRGRVSEGGRPRYFRRLSQSVFDVEDLRYRARELATFVRNSAAFYGLPQQSIIAVGLGNGATMAAALMLTEPTLLAGSVLFRPMLPFPGDVEAEPGSRLGGVPVLIAGARDDLLIPAEETMELERTLNAAGANVVMFWHQGAHQLAEADLVAARGWLSRVMLPAGATPEPAA